MSERRLVGLALAAVLLSACKTPELSASGRSVLPSLAPPVDMGYAPEQCRPMGTVIGKGGGSFGGGLIRNEELTRYAMNDMLNNAAQLGANVVHHSSVQFGESGGRGSSDVSSAMVTGTAYRCEGPPRGRAASTAASPAAPADAELRVLKGPAGQMLQLSLTHEGFTQLILFDSAAPDVVWWEVAPPVAPALASCQPAVLVNGELRRFTWLADAGARRVFSMGLDELRAMVAAERVVGRYCDSEWRWTATQRAQLVELRARIDEELAWKRAK